MAEITLARLTEEDREQFILDNQYAWRSAARAPGGRPGSSGSGRITERAKGARRDGPSVLTGFWPAGRLQAGHYHTEEKPCLSTEQNTN